MSKRKRVQQANRRAAYVLGITVEELVALWIKGDWPPRVKP